MALTQSKFQIIVNKLSKHDVVGAFIFKALYSMKKMIIYVSLALLITGCAGSETKKAKLIKKTESCLSDEVNLDTALACLKGKGYKEWRQYKNATTTKSCGAYWGYPLVASCSGIVIEHEGNKIKSYHLWAELDGV